jgi:hypothetical protein
LGKINQKSLKLAKGFLKKIFSTSHLFEKSAVKFPRLFFNEPILIRVKVPLNLRLLCPETLSLSISHRFEDVRDFFLFLDQ